MNARYNGWKNYETWNVFLWISNDENLYRAAVGFMRSYKGRRPYLDFIARNGLAGERTLDGVRWDGNKLGLAELNRAIRELA